MQELNIHTFGDYSLMANTENEAYIFIRKVTTHAGDMIRGVVARWDEVQDTNAVYTRDECARLALLSLAEQENEIRERYDTWASDALTCDECDTLAHENDVYKRRDKVFCSHSCAAPYGKG